MRLTLLTLLTLFTLAALSAVGATRAAAQDSLQAPPGVYGPDAAPWSRYTYPGDEFSVETPGMPYVMHSERGANVPGRRDKFRVFGRYSGGVVYFLAAFDRPRSSESFDNFASSYLRGSWGLTRKGETTLGGFEGRAYAVTTRPGGRVPQPPLYGEGRVFLTKKHAYFALALSPEEGRPEVTRFLDSLTLGPDPQGERVAESAPVPRYTPPTTTATPAGVVGPGRGGADDGESLRLQGPGTRTPTPARDPNTRRAIIVYKPEPTYTEEGRRNGVNGSVRLRLVLHASGAVRDISVLSPLPDGLTESAISAARYMLFFPAVKDGRPVSQYVVVEHNFNIY